VILLVLVAILWIVVLLPGAVRRFTQRDSRESIDHFHHQLQLLEHAGPKLVTPAYRLHTAVPGGAEAVAEPTPPSARPKLVLLRPVGDDVDGDVDGVDGTHYERVAALEPPEPPSSLPYARVELAAHRREQARRRCTLSLRLLTAATITSGIVGMLPSARMVWVATGIFGLALLGLIALMGYAREVEALHRRSGSAYGVGMANPFDPGMPLRPAVAGYPGAWDDELDLTPRAATN